MNGFDLIIIGGGPAGLAAGIQAGHMGLAVKILEKETWGGRLCLARRVENLPSLTQPLSGVDVAAKMLTQARWKVLAMAIETCESIGYRGRSFHVNTVVNTHTAKAIIIACGVHPKRLAVPGIEATDNRVFYTWRELPQIKGKRIAIMGGGEAAFDQACSLAERGASVTILIRGSAPRAFPGLVQEAQDLGIALRTNSEIKCAEMKGPLVSLRFADADCPTCHVDYLLAAVGTLPTEVKISKAAANRAGHGLYWAGDVCACRYRQAAIASGDGIKAAMIVYEYLRGEKGP